MSELYKKIRDSWIYSFLFSCFLLATFLGFFYLVNLDIKPNQNKLSVQDDSFKVDKNEELKKRLAATDISILNYEDWAMVNNLDQGKGGYDSDPDGDGLPNYLEYVHMTNPLAPDTDKDGFSDKQEIVNGYDPDAPGDTKPAVEISIEKLKISAPMVWSTSDDEKAQLKDLESGVSHFPKTASPGQTGNMIISGHSSNYIWAAGNYNYIFKNLNDLIAGDKISVRTTQKNGRVITYQYKITGKDNVVPDDEKIFANTSTPTLTLSTCWPLGTNFRRLIVKAELVK